LKILLQGGKKRVKRIGERTIINNVHKFMKTESELGITISLSKVQKRFAEATHVNRRIYVVTERIKNVETGVAMTFSTPLKSDRKFAQKVY